MENLENMLGCENDIKVVHEFYNENLKESIKRGAHEAYECFRHHYKRFHRSLEFATKENNYLEKDSFLLKEIATMSGYLIMNDPLFKDNFYRDKIMMGDRRIVDLSEDELREFGKSRYAYDSYQDQKSIFDKYIPAILDASKKYNATINKDERDAIIENISHILNEYCGKSREIIRERENFDEYFQDKYDNMDVCMIYAQTIL